MIEGFLPLNPIVPYYQWLACHFFKLTLHKKDVFWYTKLYMDL